MEVGKKEPLAFLPPANTVIDTNAIPSISRQSSPDATRSTLALAVCPCSAISSSFGVVPTRCSDQSQQGHCLVVLVNRINSKHNNNHRPHLSDSSLIPARICSAAQTITRSRLRSRLPTCLAQRQLRIISSSNSPRLTFSVSQLQDPHCLDRPTSLLSSNRTPLLPTSLGLPQTRLKPNQQLHCSGHQRLHPQALSLEALLHRSNLSPNRRRGSPNIVYGIRRRHSKTNSLQRAYFTSFLFLLGFTQ